MEDKRIAALQFLTNRYIDNVWKHMGIHLLAAGWILSSAQLQDGFKKSTWVQLVLTLIFGIMQWVHCVINWPIYNHIKELEQQIESTVDKAPSELVVENLHEFYGVSSRRFFWNEFMIFSIFVIAVAFVWGSPYL